MHTSRDWEDGYAGAGSLIRSCAQPTASTARAPVALEIYVQKKRSGDVGNPANRLPAHASRFLNHEPRLPARRQLLTRYLYSANRLKYPLWRVSG